MIKMPNQISLHVTPIQIRFNDIDIIGHVNNAVYQNYFDLAKTHFFDHVFGNAINWKVSGLILAHIDIDFSQPVFLDDQIIIETTFTKHGQKSVQMTQIVREKNSTTEQGIKAVGHSVMVAFDFTKNCSIEIPNLWLEAIKKHLV